MPAPLKTAHRVPATTANLGPGFDALGLALNLYNTVTVENRPNPWPSDFFAEAARSFYQAAQLPEQALAVGVTGDVPRSRGLGSSVTVRLGLLLGLNELHGDPLSRDRILQLLISLEGHPDNAIPGLLGGFVAAHAGGHVRVPVDESLTFVTLVPDGMLETSDARAVLPAQVAWPDAIGSIQRATVIAAAFASRNYAALRGACHDVLHQPHRLPRIPGSLQTLHAAHDAGALGSFLSGSGTALMALTPGNPQPVADAMLAAYKQYGSANCRAHILLLKADNTGATRVSLPAG